MTNSQKKAINLLKWRADLDALQQHYATWILRHINQGIRCCSLQQGDQGLWLHRGIDRGFQNKVGTITAANLATPRTLCCTSLSGLRHKNVTVFAWSDSTIVLSWLTYAPAQLKTFVGNRTS